MPEYDNNNRGCLFTNRNKKEGDKRPYLTGKITLGPDVVEYARKQIAAGKEATLEVSQWKFSGDRGTRYPINVQLPYNVRSGRSEEGDDISY